MTRLAQAKMREQTSVEVVAVPEKQHRRKDPCSKSPQDTQWQVGCTNQDESEVQNKVMHWGSQMDAELRRYLGTCTLPERATVKKLKSQAGILCYQAKGPTTCTGTGVVSPCLRRE